MFARLVFPTPFGAYNIAIGLFSENDMELFLMNELYDSPKIFPFSNLVKTSELLEALSDSAISDIWILPFSFVAMIWFCSQHGSKASSGKS